MIPLFSAISQMRQLSHEGKSFSFSHATLNRDTRTSSGIRHVRRAHLRPAAKGDDLTEADHKLFYVDEDLDKPRVCWQILITEFEDQKIIVS